MLLIQQITDNALQQQTFILSDGSSFNFTMRFVPMQYGWFLQNLTYKTFVINGVRICNSPNMLNQYRNQIPFGLACYSTANREPSQQQDFLSGASNLYVLSQAECLQYANFLSSGSFG